MAIVHFVFGMTVGLWLETMVLDDVVDRLLLVYCVGILAMVPDLNKVLPGLGGLHDSMLANVFLLHRVLDRIDPNDTILAGIVMLALFGISLAVTWYHDRR